MEAKLEAEHLTDLKARGEYGDLFVPPRAPSLSELVATWRDSWADGFQEAYVGGHATYDQYQAGVGQLDRIIRDSYGTTPEGMAPGLLASVPCPEGGRLEVVEGNIDDDMSEVCVEYVPPSAPEGAACRLAAVTKTTPAMSSCFETSLHVAAFDGEEDEPTYTCYDTAGSEALCELGLSPAPPEDLRLYDDAPSRGKGEVTI